MNNNVLAVENILRPTPTPQTATSDTPRHPFPSIEAKPKTQNTPHANTHDQPPKSDNITPYSTKKPNLHPVDDKKTSKTKDVSKPQNKPRPDQTETTPSPEQHSTDPLTSALQSAANPEIATKPTAEAVESTIDAQLAKTLMNSQSTVQLQQQAIPEPSAAKASKPAQPQLLEEAADTQREQHLIQQELTEETAKTASSPSTVAPEARQSPKEAITDLLTPLTKETTVPAATITPTVKPQPEDNHQQTVSFDSQKTALADQQAPQPGLTGGSAGRNPLGRQVPAEQTKRTQKGNTDNASALDIERLLSQHEAQPRVTQLTEPAVSATSAGKSAQASSPPVQLPTPAEQIIESIHSTLSRDLATRQITIRLNPPELGKVAVQFDQHEDEITGLLKVATLQTRHEVEQALPEIVRHLQNAGVQLKRLDVVLNDQAQQQAFREHAQGHNPFAQDEFGRGSGTAGDSLSQWLRLDDINGTGAESPMLLTDHSINMLI